MNDLQRQADWAASAIIMDTGIRTPVENYETLLGVVAAGWLSGRLEALREVVGLVSPDALSDPSDAEIRHE